MELLKWKKNKANGCRLGIPEGALAFEELAEERCPKPQRQASRVRGGEESTPSLGVRQPRLQGKYGSLPEPPAFLQCFCSPVIIFSK